MINYDNYGIKNQEETQSTPQQLNYTFNQFIGVFHNVIPKEQCQYIRSWFDVLHERGLSASRKQIEGVSKTEKDTENIYVELCHTYEFDTQSRIIAPVIENMHKCHEIYANEYDFLWSGVDRYMIDHALKYQRTDVGGGYHVWHCENGGTPYGRRVLSVLIYFNDVYEGGETEFLYQKLRVKPTEGTVVIFPSAWTHVHRGNPPISNNKYAMTSWYVFNDYGPLP